MASNLIYLLCFLILEVGDCTEMLQNMQVEQMPLAQERQGQGAHSAQEAENPVESAATLDSRP